MSDYLRNYYENYNEDGRLGTKYGMVEFLTTMLYINRYLASGHKILEIGAGTGRYSHALARQGYAVDAVELIERNIEIFKKNTTKGDKVTIAQGDARNLCNFEDNTYDVTLMLGPMYHLFTVEDKLAALSETLRVTKPGGVVFVAYCIADPSILDHGFIRGNIHELIEKGMLDTESFKTKSNPWDIFELHRKEDIDALMENFDITRLRYVATDGYANHIREVMETWDDATFDVFLKYHFTICERADMVG